MGKARSVYLFFLLIFMSAMLVNCTPPKTDTLKGKAQQLTFSIVDSIPMFRDSLVFNQFDINFSKNKILLFGEFSGVFELDLNTNKLLKISDLGSSYGQINISMFIAKYLPDDRILVAEILSSGKIYLFDRDRKLIFTKKYSDLFPDRGEMSPFICSNIDILSFENDTTILGLGVMVYPTSVPGWEIEDCFSKLILYGNEVHFLSSHFPLRQNDFIKNAIEKKIEYSPFTIPRICSDEKNVYIKFIFDKSIYVSDKEFKNLSKIDFSPVYKTYDFYTENSKIASSKENIKQNFCNIFIESFYFHNNKIFQIYPKPVPPEIAPKTIEEIRETEHLNRNRVVQILNIKNGQEYFAYLPPKIDGHNLKVQNDSTIYLLGNKHFQQDTYIYIANLK